MRDGLREVTTLRNLRKCGKTPVAPLVSLHGEAGGRSGYGGLATCASVWACPVCSAKIAARRKDEVAQVIKWAEAQGLRVSMLTLTQRHHMGQKLNELWKALSYAWGRVTSGRRWVEFKEQLGVVGYVRAVEVTHGKHGWHVHQHVLVLSEKDPTVTPVFYQRKQGRARHPYPVEVTRSADFIADRWEAGLAKKGVDFLRDSGGLDWRTAEPGDAEAMGRYVAKLGTAGMGEKDSAGLSAEVTLGGFKKARQGNRTPFQIAQDLLQNGEAEDFALWLEWEKASYGKRALTWSQGLKEAALIEEKTDEEIAEESPEGDTVLLLDKANWYKVREAGAVKLLHVLEKRGAKAARRWCKRRNIAYVLPVRIYKQE